MGITGKTVTFSNSVNSLACKAALAREACPGVSTERVRCWQRGLIKIVLSSYIFQKQDKKKTKTNKTKGQSKTKTVTVSFKFVWLLNLFLHTADLMPGLYTETKACGGSPAQKYERIQRTVSIYKRWPGRRPCLQVYSLTADYLKTRSVVQKPARRPRTERLCPRF